MGREVRRVPKDWEHPKGSTGHCKPLYGGSYTQEAAEWDTENEKWGAGFKKDWSSGGYVPKEVEQKNMSFAEWSGERPDEEDYMPDWEEQARTHYQMYETTSEGSPISPVMETPEELARWLTGNGASAFGGQGASYEGWLRVCGGGYACSGVMINGAMQSGVDGLTNAG